MCMLHRHEKSNTTHVMANPRQGQKEISVNFQAWQGHCCTLHCRTHKQPDLLLRLLLMPKQPTSCGCAHGPGTRTSLAAFDKCEPTTMVHITMSFLKPQPPLGHLGGVVLPPRTTSALV